MSTGILLPSTQTHLLGRRDGHCSRLSDMVWLAGLGRPELKRMYELDGSFVDVFNDRDGIGCRLKWKRSEREIYLYDSKPTGGPLMPA